MREREDCGFSSLYLSVRGREIQLDREKVQKGGRNGDSARWSAFEEFYSIAKM